MSVKYTDPALVSDPVITPTPTSPYVNAYGPKIPTRYKLRYGARMHRVYMMQYSNSGVPYIQYLGEDLILDIDTTYLLEALTEGGRSSDPQGRN